MAETVDPDPELTYRLSDREFNRKTYYMVLGLWLFLASTTGVMVYSTMLR